MLGLSIAALGVCEQFCTAPCAVLNGNVASECNTCIGAEYKCRPGEPDYKVSGSWPEDDDPPPPPVHVEVDASGVAVAEPKVREVQGAAVDPWVPELPEASSNCADLADRSVCERLAGEDACNVPEMKMHCASTCNACDFFKSSNQSCSASKPCVPELSLFDEEMLAFKADGKSTCSASAILLRAARCDTSSLGDERRMADRGYFVLRGAVPPEELETMKAFVDAVPDPKRLLCGASDVQPPECMFGGEDIKERFFDMYNKSLKTVVIFFRTF